MPDTTRAAYSPRLWPATMSGLMPYCSNRRAMAISPANMAGWQTLVSLSASRVAVLSSALMNVLSGLPRMGSMIRSASRKVSSTTGSCSRSSLNMPIYCEPCPGKMKATLASCPWPRKMPCPAKARQAAGLSLSRAESARWPRLARSSSHPCSMTIRSSDESTSAAGIAVSFSRGRERASSSECRKACTSVAPTASILREASSFAFCPLPPAGNARGFCAGRYSPRTAWKLVPPKPNADRPAIRGLSPATFHFTVSLGT